MLFTEDLWSGLADGTVTLAFRRWKRPSVKAGGTLQSPGGLLAIDAVEAVSDDAVSDCAARLAGRRDRSDLLASLGPDEPGRQLYRVAFHRLGDDPRVALRADDRLDESAIRAIGAALARLDRSAPDLASTAAILEVIARMPAVRAGDLADELGCPRDWFKLRVRRLKALGLTESLLVGYRLSPRGEAYRAAAASGRGDVRE
jgi:hypothetical protein